MSEAMSVAGSNIAIDSQRVRVTMAAPDIDQGATARIEVETDGARRVEVAMLAGGGWAVTIGPATERG